MQGVCAEVEDQTNHVPVSLLCCEMTWTARRLCGHVDIEAVSVSAVVLQELVHFESWPSADYIAAPGPFGTFRFFLTCSSRPTLPLGPYCIAKLRPLPVVVVAYVALGSVLVVIVSDIVPVILCLMVIVRRGGRHRGGHGHHSG